MEKFRFRAVIDYLQKKGLAPKAIHEDLVKTYGENAPSYSMTKKWAAEFKRGRESLEDDYRCGRPVSVVTQENITKVLDIVMTDRRVTTRHIASTLGISQTTAYNILTNDLKMTKVSARWVPRLLTPEQKRTRLITSRDNLRMFDMDPADFLARFVTVDETWVHHFTPETKRQSMQWKHTDSPPPKKAKVTLSAGKVMATVFWDCEGILLADFLDKGHTVTGEYYSLLLRQLRKNIVSKRHGKLTKGELFHHNNAPPHRSAVAMATIQQCGFELVPHPPYSPDLAPSDFHLFPNLKKYLGGQRYSTDNDVMEAVRDYFQSLPEAFFKEGIAGLKHRWEKCVLLGGDYVEK